MNTINKLISFLWRGAHIQNKNEHEMARNRFVIASVFLVILVLFLEESQDLPVAILLELYGLYCIASLAILISICLRPAESIARVAFGLLINIVGLIYLGILFGPTGIGYLYPGFLLMIYGYGFRYGGRWLAISSGLSVLAFIVIFTISPLWRGQQMMAGGILISFILLPPYVGDLVRKVWREKALAEEMSRTKSLFVAAVSHDLRTPLNAIIGLGDLLSTSKIPVEEADMARMIGAAGRSLLTLVDSVLELSQLEMGRTPVTAKQIDLFDMLFQLRELLDVSASAKRLRLSLCVTSPCPRFIIVSERYIKDSLMNLVGNAVKFTQEGSVTIKVSCVTHISDRIRLRFEVVDTGIGISANAHERIFENFSQANSHIRGAFGGSGLGLAIVKQLVTALNGEVGVISEKGKGSTFWFEVEALAAPLKDAPSPTLATARAIVLSSSEAFKASVLAVSPQALCADTFLKFNALWAKRGARNPTIIIDGACCDAAMSAYLAALLSIRCAKRANIILCGEAWPTPLQGPSLQNPDIAACAILISSQAKSGQSRRNALVDALTLASGLGLAIAPENARCNRPGKAILIADDNRTNQIVLEKMLTRAGHYPVLANDGQAALDKIAEASFDLVLMDINMPIIDGVEATRLLREREADGDYMPVIALTADVTPVTRTRCFEAGMDACITKPVDLPQLLAVIDQWTEKASSPAQTPPLQADLAVVPADFSGSLNPSVIEDLEKLGGRDFVREIAMQFIADASHILQSLTSAVRDNDIAKFRDEAHALRSCSANIGAQVIFETCLSWRDIEVEEFVSESAARLIQLEREFTSVRAALEPYCKQAA